MNETVKKYYFLIILLIISTALKAQKSSDKTIHRNSSKHLVTLIISHTQVNEGFDENHKKQWLSLPSWGINYNYSLTNKWTLGIHTDIIIEDFKVEKLSGNEQVNIERSFPVASSIVTTFKPGKHLSFMLGTGAEYTKDNTFFLWRTGVEHGLHIEYDWDLIANITNDFKFNAYNSWAIGLGIASRL